MRNLSYFKSLNLPVGDKFSELLDEFNEVADKFMPSTDKKDFEELIADELHSNNSPKKCVEELKYIFRVAIHVFGNNDEESNKE